MIVMVAPDKLKGTLSAEKAASALARGIRREGHDADECPLADGGEGTLDAWLTPSGVARTASVMGPDGETVEARWGLAPDGSALVESAEAIGLSRSTASDVLGATSFGVGELVKHALDAGARRIVVALGGSATSDAGIGMAQALGVRFEGAREPASASDLESVTRVDTSGIDPRLASVELIAACDVMNPLTGPRGAALLFAPQKGATPAIAVRIERATARFVALAGGNADTPGSGAAGGLGFALAHFARARLVSGADFVLDHVGFEERLRGVDLVVTAEGRLDRQTLEGKLVKKICERANQANVPAIVIAGSVEIDTDALGARRSYSLVEEAGSEERAQREVEHWLAETAARALREL
jgi:glycerate kinase